MGKGCDYAWDRPNMAALRAAGIGFACRYLSYDRHGKNLSRNEATALQANGIAPVSNWEWTEKGSLGGYAAGAQHARDADFQHFACGGPPDRPIYFSVDFDAQPVDMHQIAAYFDGVASVIGVGRTGVYGGFFVCSSLLNTGRVRWLWQTSAWSGGRVHPRAVIYQHQYNVRIGGGYVDIDESYGTDFGQWGAASPGSGEQPAQTGSVDLAAPLTDATTWVGQGVGGLDGPIARLNQLLF